MILPGYFRELRGIRMWEADFSHLSEPTAFNDGYDAGFADLLPLLETAIEAMQMGAFHHNACPWLNGNECCCANEKVKSALEMINEKLGRGE